MSGWSWLKREGTLLAPPIGRTGVGLTSRTITSNNQTLLLTDTLAFLDATLGNRNVTLPDANQYVGELRLVAVHQNSNQFTVSCASGQTINGPDLPAVTSVALGPILSQAPLSVISLVPTSGSWTYTGGSRNQLLTVPYGLVSQMQAPASLGDGSVYAATDALAGAGVTYQVQRIAGVKTSVPIGFGPQFPVSTVTPTISKNTVGGITTLTAANGTWSDPAATFTYQWRKQGTAIGGATAQTYILTNPDYGQPITVVVTGTNSHGSSTAESPSVTSSQVASLTVAQSIALLTSAGAASSGSLALSAGAAVPTGPADVNLKYLKFPSGLPQQVTENPGIRLILTNRSVQTPVQPWLINGDGTLFGAAQSTLTGALPTFPGASSMTVLAPVGTDFDTGGGLLWVVGVGFVTYTSYNASTHVSSGLDSRYSGTPSVGAAVYQVRLPRLEPGNTGNQSGATSWGVLNVTMSGVPATGLRVAFQNLVVVESGGFSCGTLAWMV